jgi:hypothetical protein
MKVLVVTYLGYYDEDGTKVAGVYEKRARMERELTEQGFTPNTERNQWERGDENHYPYAFITEIDVTEGV